MGRREAGIPYNFDASEHLAVESFMPAQYAAMRERRESSPELKLMFAIFEGALRDILNWTPGLEESEHMGSRERLYWEARRWVMTRDDYVFSFDTICAAFKVDADGIRARIMAGQFKRTRRSAAKSNGKVSA